MAHHLISFGVSDVRKEMLALILARHMAYERTKTFRTRMLPRVLTLAFIAWIFASWVVPALRTLLGPIVEIVVVTAFGVIAAELWARHQFVKLLKRAPRADRTI